LSISVVDIVKVLVHVVLAPGTREVAAQVVGLALSFVIAKDDSETLPVFVAV
jgi:ribosomal protein S7